MTNQDHCYGLWSAYIASRSARYLAALLYNWQLYQIARGMLECQEH